MTIITNLIRERIASAVVRHGFKARVDALVEASNALATEIYHRVYSAQSIKAMETLTDKVGASFNTTTSFMVNCGGPVIAVGFYSGSRHSSRTFLEYSMQESNLASFRVVSKHSSGNRMLDLEADDELALRIIAYGESVVAISEEMASRRIEVAGVLTKARTDGQLEALWPEVMPIAREFIKTPAKEQLPMVPTANLNAALGLPPAIAA